MIRKIRRVTITTHTREVQIAIPHSDNAENAAGHAAGMTCPVCHTPLQALAPANEMPAIELIAHCGGNDTEEK